VKGLLGPFTFVVTGSYGSEPIKGSATFNFPKPLPTNLQKITVSFNGHIGTQRVSGTATARYRGKGLVLAATFSVH
jgi:hypothetical protein